VTTQTWLAASKSVIETTPRVTPLSFGLFSLAEITGVDVSSPVTHALLLPRTSLWTLTTASWKCLFTSVTLTFSKLLHWPPVQTITPFASCLALLLPRP